MAKRVVTTIITSDDLSGEDVPHGHGATFHFGWEGNAYEIDLGDDNAAQVRALMGRLTDAGRKIGRFRPEVSAPKKKAVAAHKDSAPALPSGDEPLTPYQEIMRRREFVRHIREWAREQGMQQSNTGRLRPEVREAWDAAHPDNPAPEENPAAWYDRQSTAV